MIVVHRNPLDLLKNIFSPPKQRIVQVPSPAADAAAEDRAAREAARKARAEAFTRQGQRSTLLTPVGGGSGTSSISSTRRTLLGATPVG